LAGGFTDIPNATDVTYPVITTNGTYYVAVRDKNNTSNVTNEAVVISCITGTTSTTTTTTTTTTSAPTCNSWKLYTNGNSGDGGCFDYYNCANTLQNICVDNSADVYICAIGTPTQSSGTGVNASNQGACSTTTTTTTTTAAACNEVNVTSTDPTYGATINAVLCDGSMYYDPGMFGSVTLCILGGNISVAGGTYTNGGTCT
jgi:hypothetical protein